MRPNSVSVRAHHTPNCPPVTNSLRHMVCRKKTAPLIHRPFCLDSGVIMGALRQLGPRFMTRALHASSWHSLLPSTTQGNIPDCTACNMLKRYRGAGSMSDVFAFLAVLTPQQVCTALRPAHTSFAIERKRSPLHLTTAHHIPQIWTGPQLVW